MHSQDQTAFGGQDIQIIMQRLGCHKIIFTHRKSFNILHLLGGGERHRNNIIAMICLFHIMPSFLDENLNVGKVSINASVKISVLFDDIDKIRIYFHTCNLLHAAEQTHQYLFTAPGTDDKHVILFVLFQEQERNRIGLPD